MRRTLMLPALLALGLSAGCAEMGDTGRRTTTGAGVGALSGAAIGSFSGNAGWGALAGAGVGAAGGYLYDRSRKAEESAYQQGVQEGRRQAR